MWCRNPTLHALLHLIVQINLFHFLYILVHILLTYLLTPWCRVLLEKPIGLQLVKKFPAFHGTRRFITAITSVRHLSLSWASPIQSIYPHPTYWRSVLILSTHLRLGLPSGLFPSGFPVHILQNLITDFLIPITHIIVTTIIKAVQSTTLSCPARCMTLSSIRTNFITLCPRLPDRNLKQNKMMIIMRNVQLWMANEQGKRERLNVRRTKGTGMSGRKMVQYHLKQVLRSTSGWPWHSWSLINTVVVGLMLHVTLFVKNNELFHNDCSKQYVYCCGILCTSVAAACDRLRGTVSCITVFTLKNNVIYKHRVIRNDCRGFNNLPYTIHLR